MTTGLRKPTKRAVSSALIRRVRVWDAEGRCPKGHLHFARSQDGAKAARAIVKADITRCSQGLGF